MNIFSDYFLTVLIDNQLNTIDTPGLHWAPMVSCGSRCLKGHRMVSRDSWGVCTSKLNRLAQRFPPHRLAGPPPTSPWKCMKINGCPWGSMNIREEKRRGKRKEKRRKEKTKKEKRIEEERREEKRIDEKEKIREEKRESRREKKRKEDQTFRQHF